MYKLQYLILKAIHFFGIFFGLVTFVYNCSTGHLIDSKTLKIYNKTLTVLVIASIWLLISQSFNEETVNQSIFKTVTSVFVLCSRYIMVIRFSVMSFKEKNLIKQIASRAQMLVDSIGICGKNETESSIRAFILILMELISFLVVLKMAMTSSNECSLVQLSLTISMHFIYFATTFTTLMYILTMKLISNMLSKLNSDIQKALRQLMEFDHSIRNSTQTSSQKCNLKKLKMDLECYTIFYFKLIDFVKTVHSLWSAQIAICLITKMEALINSVCFVKI